MTTKNVCSIMIGKEKFNFRRLKRGEVRELRKKHGIVLGALRVDQVDEAMDMILQKVCDAATFKRIDQLENRDALKIWREVMKETFGSEDEEKNS